jgi:hypothetical protein
MFEEQEGAAAAAPSVHAAALRYREAHGFSVLPIGCR